MKGTEGDIEMSTGDEARVMGCWKVLCWRERDDRKGIRKGEIRKICALRQIENQILLSSGRLVRLIASLKHEILQRITS